MYAKRVSCRWWWRSRPGRWPSQVDVGRHAKDVATLACSPTQILVLGPWECATCGAESPVFSFSSREVDELEVALDETVSFGIEDSFGTLRLCLPAPGKGCDLGGDSIAASLLDTASPPPAFCTFRYASPIWFPDVYDSTVLFKARKSSTSIQ